METLATLGRQFAQKGWEVVEGVFEREECDQIAELALKYIDHQPLNEEGVPEPRKVKAAYPCDAAFRRFVHDNRLVSLVGRLLGGREPLLMKDQIFMKAPRHGSAKPYHQDNAYFKCEPNDQIVTAWISLDDVDEANGCLRYIDGSHKDGLLSHQPLDDQTYNKTPNANQIDQRRQSSACVGKGGVVFHHSQTLHMSGRNESDGWRRGFATHWVTDQVHGDSAIFKRAHFHEPDYPRLD